MPMSQAEKDAKFENWKKDMIAKGKVAPEAFAPFESSPEARQAIIDSNMAQSDYSRGSQENARIKQQFDADQAALNKWRTDVEATINKANLTVEQERAQRQKAEREYLNARTKLASKYNVDESELNELLPTNFLTEQTDYQPPPAPHSNGNGNGFKPQPEYATQQQLLQAQLMGLAMQDKRAQLANRHRQFFNEDLDNYQEIVLEADRRATAQGRPFDPTLIDDVWKEKYNVAGKEDEIRRKQVEDIEKQAYERGRMEGLTQAALPTSAGGGVQLPGRPGIRALIPVEEGQGSSDDQIVRNATAFWRGDYEKRVAAEGQTESK